MLLLQCGHAAQTVQARPRTKEGAQTFLIPLDIFRKVLYNRGIKSDLDAWLTLLSVDEPEWIIRLLDTYPQFKPVYEQAYDLCRNIEGVMDMFFSEELRILDANTVHIMVDEMQEELDALTTKKNKLTKEKNKLNKENNKLANENDKLSKENDKLANENDKLANENDKLANENGKLANENEEQNKVISAQREFAKRQAAEIEEKDTELAAQRKIIAELKKQLGEK